MAAEYYNNEQKGAVERLGEGGYDLGSLERSTELHVLYYGDGGTRR